MEAALQVTRFLAVPRRARMSRPAPELRRAAAEGVSARHASSDRASAW
jgi:hypothetical protein